MRRSLAALAVVVILAAGADGDQKPAKKENMTSFGIWYGEIKKCAEDGDQFTLRVYHWEPFHESIPLDRIWTLHIWGVRRQFNDGEVHLRDDFKVRTIPPPELGTRGRLKPAKIVKDKSDPDRALVGEKGERSDIEVGKWVGVKLHKRVYDGRLFASVVVVQK